MIEGVTDDPNLPYRVLRGRPEESEEILAAYFRDKGWLPPERAKYYELLRVLYTKILEQKLAADPRLRGELLTGGQPAVSGFFATCQVRPPRNAALYLKLLRSADFGRVHAGRT